MRVAIIFVSDVDECQLPNRCDSHSLCVNSPGSYMCVCLAGYTGDSRNRSCQDLDECATDMNSCGQNAVCINTFSSFSCKCREGWFGDGRMCFGEWRIETSEKSASYTLLMMPNNAETAVHGCWLSSYIFLTTGFYLFYHCRLGVHACGFNILFHHVDSDQLVYFDVVG